MWNQSGIEKTATRKARPIEAGAVRRISNSIGIVKMTTQIKHSGIGPSSYKRVSLCPGSMKLSAMLDNPSSDDAKRGTNLHELAANWLRHGLDAILDATEEDCEAVSFYVSHCVAQRADAIQYWIEERFHIPGSELLFGTPDFAAVHDDGILTIVDFKSGREKVVAEGNTQLLYYALAVYENLPEPDKIEQCVLQIAQYGNIYTWTVPVADLIVFKNQLLATLDEALKEDAPLTPGTEQCQYCNAKAICPAFKADLEQRSGLTLENISGMKVANIPQLIEQRYMYVDEWRKYLDAIEKQALALPEKGYVFEHFQVKQKEGNRRWKDEAFVTGLLEQSLRDDAFEKKVKSPTQIMQIIEKATRQIAKKAKIPQPTLALLNLREDLEAQIERPISGIKLVKRGEENATNAEVEAGA